MKLALLVLGLFLGLKQPLPEINKKIVDYTLSQEGKQVDRGECWDLAAIALNEAGAVWETPYNFGTKYNYKKDTILPGDVIQFENVEFKGELYRITMPHHTAIVVEVQGPLKLKIAHQNFAGKRTVQLTELDFNDVKKGQLQFFHPKAK